MSNLSERVAHRFIIASLGVELERKINGLLTGTYDAVEAIVIGRWFEDNFRITSPKTPRGQKALKAKAEHLRWVLRSRISFDEKFVEKLRKEDPEGLARSSEAAQKEVRGIWAELKPQLDNLVRYFTDEGGTTVPKELKLGGVTYINEVGVPEASLKKYAARLSVIFKALQGWRKKAMAGNLEVVLASPRNFRGTAGGVYRSAKDQLYIRATPNVLKRSGGGYGSFEYIIVHELGHRYERFNTLPTDFDRPKWWTTPYSQKDALAGSEAFAELFALGHFRLKGTWSDIVEKFEDLMA
jgi:hypothetical protein